MNKYFELIIKGTDIKIEEIRKCKYCREEFAIYDIEKKLYDKHGFKYCETCPLCTFKLQNIFFNDRNFYKNKDSETGEKLVSIIHKGYKGKIIEAKRYKDKISDDLGFKYAKDLKEDILGEFKNLYDEFPKPSRLIYPDLENSIYSTHSGWSKNVYLSGSIFIDCEDVYYSQRILSNCKNIFYSFNILESSNIYNSSTVGNSHNIFHSFNVGVSSDIYFGYDIYNCKNCLFCCNQVNSSYKIFNRQYEKQEYEKIKSEIMEKLKIRSGYKFLEQEFFKFLENNYISQSYNINRCEKVVGESTFSSYNTINSFMGAGLENCINTITSGDADSDKNTNLFNCSENGTNCENCIGSSSFGQNIYNCFFSFGITSNSKNIYYSYYLESCEECMFCVGLKSKKYCILNKQYEKDKYFEIKKLLIEKLKKDNLWGEEFPYELSIFPYNDTLSYDYFKVNRIINYDKTEKIINNNAVGTVRILENKEVSDAILDLGGENKLKIKWKTREKDVIINNNYDIAEDKEVEDIEKVNESILSKVIICEKTKKPFKIVKKELDFLKNKGLSITNYHYNHYLEEHLSRRPIGKFYVSNCDNCKEEILSVYKTKPKHKVFCEKCYNKKVFS